MLAVHSCETSLLNSHYNYLSFMTSSMEGLHLTYCIWLVQLQGKSVFIENLKMHIFFESFNTALDCLKLYFIVV